MKRWLVATRREDVENVENVGGQVVDQARAAKCPRPEHDPEAPKDLAEDAGKEMQQQEMELEVPAVHAKALEDDPIEEFHYCEGSGHQESDTEGEEEEDPRVNRWEALPCSHRAMLRPLRMF